MANEKEKTDINRKKLDELAEFFFPMLSAPELVRLAREFEDSLK